MSLSNYSEIDYPGNTFFPDLRIWSRCPYWVPHSKFSDDYLYRRDKWWRKTDRFARKKSETSVARVALYKNTLFHYYKTRVKDLCFDLGDLVLRKNSVSRSESQGKLTSKWEGSYRVTQFSLNDYCTLTYWDGTLVPPAWDVENLKLYRPWCHNS